jgi:hypothetical protein
MKQIFSGSGYRSVEITSSSELALYIWAMSREIELGKFHFARIPRRKFRIEAWLNYYSIWIRDLLGGKPLEKDSIKILAVK